MDEDKGNPNSQPPSPLPSWLEDEALSGQWLGAVGGSDLPLSETEEGAFAHMDDDWIYETDEDLFQCADVTAWEEDVTLQELYRWKEEVRVQERSERGDRRHRELYEFEDVRVRALSQRRDGRHPELYQCEESVRCQELHEWEEGGVRYHELTQWEEHVTVQEVPQREEEETYQELSQWGDLRGQELSQWGDVEVRELSQREGGRYRDLPQWEEDVQGHRLYQWKDKRDPELSQVGDKTDKKQSQEEDYSAQELPQREDGSEKKLSQWGDDVSYNTWDKSWRQVNAGDAQTAAQDGPSSASSMAAAPAGAAEEEEPQGPLAPEEEEAEGSPTFGEQVPSAGTQSQIPAPRSPSEGSEALLDTNQYITSEIVRKAVLVIQESSQQPKEEKNHEQTVDTDMVTTVPVEQTESPVPAPQSPPESSQALLDMVKLIITEIVQKAVLVFQGSDQQLEEQRVLEQSTATLSPSTATGTQSLAPASHSPSESSEALLDTNQSIPSEIMRKAELVIQGSGQQPEGQRNLEQTTATETVAIVPAERTESPIPAPRSPSEGSEALLDTEHPISTEVRSEPELVFQGSGQQPEEQRNLEQTMGADNMTTVPAEMEESSIPAPQSPCSHSSPSPSQLEAQALSEQEEEGLFTGEGIKWKYYIDQEISQWEDEGDQELSQEEINTYQEASQREDCIEQELSPGQVKSCQELSDWEEYSEEEETQGEVKSYQEVSDWEENIEQEQSQGEESSSQEVSDWEEHSEEELSHGGGKSYQEVSDWEENIEQEQSQGEERGGQEVSDWEGYSEEELSHGGVKSYQEVSDWEDYSEEDQSEEVKRDLELCDWEDYSEKEQSQEVKRCKEQSDREEYNEEEQSQEVKRCEELSNREEYSEEEQSQEVKRHKELSDWEDYSEEEQSQEVKRHKELSNWEDYSKKEQSHRKGSSSPEVTDLEECSTQAQPQRKFSNYQDLLSDWEDSIAEELSQDEDSFGQEFSDWGDYRPSVLSQWEDDSDRELALADWEHTTVHSFGAKPLFPEEDEWEEVSVLELSQGQGTEDRLRILAEDGLPVPVPLEAWAQHRAPAPRTQVPVCASPPPLEALSTGGTEASPAFDEQTAETGIQSQVRAPRSLCCPPSPSPPQLEAQALSRQLALPRKRLSRFRRALGALRSLFCSCTLERGWREPLSPQSPLRAQQWRPRPPSAPPEDGAAAIWFCLATAAPAEPGDTPGFKQPPAALRLKRKGPRRSEPTAGAAAPAPRGPSAPAHPNPFCSLDNAPQRAVAPQPLPPAPLDGHPLAAPFWQLGPIPSTWLNNFGKGEWVSW
ncbi:trichohyalin-like [Myiozetetes cayanensis]|uniref:trichohyalin-like n=1 Tax=Myiozetetes cayanensis TaxID=478635 RepID=UPI00215E74BD|nr:trichohyalin-like [Myiozetetes cayanensis]